MLNRRFITAKLQQRNGESKALTGVNTPKRAVFELVMEKGCIFAAEKSTTSGEGQARRSGKSGNPKATDGMTTGR